MVPRSHHPEDCAMGAGSLGLSPSQVCWPQGAGGRAQSCQKILPSWLGQYQVLLRPLTGP
jgi:hypothetical protein